MRIAVGGCVKIRGMMACWIENVRALQPGEGVVAGAVLDPRRQDRQPACGPRGDLPDEGCQRIDGGGRLLTPGLIDIHTHAVGEHGYEAGPEALVAAGRLLAQYGTTCVLPTLYQIMRPGHLDKLEELARASPVPKACACPASISKAHSWPCPGRGPTRWPGTWASWKN